MTRRLIALMTLFALGCDDPLPCSGGEVADRYLLSAEGLTVEIETRPYRYTVKNSAGEVVLKSLARGKHDGYGAVGWTTGKTIWGSIASPGYFTFDAVLDPWRDDWEVAAVRTEPGLVELALSSYGDKNCVRVRHTVTKGTMRVEAIRPGGTPPRAWTFGFESPGDEAFMGFGERYNRINQRGVNLYTWAEEGGLGKAERFPIGLDNPFPNGEPMTYYPVPFFVSSNKYGFWLDSTWRNEFRLGTDRPDAWRVWDIGPRLAYEVYVPEAKPRWPYEVIDRFTERTGRPMMPPKWSFGPRRRFGNGAMKNGVPEIQAMRDLDLAITTVDDNMHFLPSGSDIGREGPTRTWVEDAHRLGYRVNGYYNPYISKTPSPLDADAAFGLANDYFLKDKTGAPSVVWLISGRFLDLYTIDVTKADAVDWFTAMFGRAINLGYTGWMYDFGEYVQPDVVASNGMSGEELHNLFPVLYDKAAHDALEAGPIAGNWLAYARSGYTGSQQYTPMVWGGDPDASFGQGNGLPAMVRGGVNLGLSGVAHWGSDIGGFKCQGEGYAGANGELLTRWIQFGAMGSNMQDQDACTTPPDHGTKANIFSSPDAQAAWKTYARLHTRMFPYLYTLAEEAHRTGAPTMRHPFFEHPERPFADVEDAYYLGPALLVAPVVERGARSREILFGDARYLHVTNKTLVRGPGKQTVAAPLEELPLYLREDRLVPLLDPTIDTLAEESDAAIIGPGEVAGVYDVVGLVGKEASFRVYDGTDLTARYTGGFAAPPLPAAATEADLATCAACYLREQLPDGVQRVRISASAGTVTAGGLTVTSTGSRRIRWDLYLVE